MVFSVPSVPTWGPLRASSVHSMLVSTFLSISLSLYLSLYLSCFSQYHQYLSVLDANIWVSQGFFITLSAALTVTQGFLIALSVEFRVSQGFISLIRAQFRAIQGFLNVSPGFRGWGWGVFWGFFCCWIVCFFQICLVWFFACLFWGFFVSCCLLFVS